MAKQLGQLVPDRLAAFQEPEARPGQLVLVLVQVLPELVPGQPVPGQRALAVRQGQLVPVQLGQLVLVGFVDP